MSNQLLENTGNLFGDLWHRYDDELFEESVQLFTKRFKANNFNLNWFEGKTCLDAGCGGGRYSIAMARLKTKEVIGIDISENGLVDARKRGENFTNVTFQKASVLDLPFPDYTFDFICCSGVLHHTSDLEKGLKELSRVLKPQGKCFLLLYGKGGLRWPTIIKIRPYAQTIGYELMNKTMKLIDMKANKQRTFLDDLFVPLINFYSWDEVESILLKNNFTSVSRWEKGRLDHEESVPVQRDEFLLLKKLFAVILEQKTPEFVAIAPQAKNALDHIHSTINELDTAEDDFQSSLINSNQRMQKIFGYGHHRLIAEKS